MNNKDLGVKLKQLMAAKIKYQKLIKVVEDEIKSRYGHFPSEVNFDAYIDRYHYNEDCDMSMSEIDSGMLDSIEMTYG